MFKRLILVTPSTRRATSSPKRSCRRGEGEFRILDDVVKQRRSQGRGVQAKVGQDVSNFQEMRDVRIAGVAELVAVAFGGDLVGAAHQPGIIGGAIQAEFFEEFLEAVVEVPFRAVTVEVQREIGARAHNQVYAEKERERSARGKRGQKGTGRLSGRPVGEEWCKRVSGRGFLFRLFLALLFDFLDPVEQVIGLLSEGVALLG